MTSNTRFRLKSLFFFGGRYIYQDNHDKSEYNQICSKHIDKAIQEFFIKMGIIFVSYLFAVVGPVQAYVLYGTKTTTTEAHFPFLEPKSNEEFIANFLLQSTIAGHGILLYAGLEVMVSCIENVIGVIPRLVESELINTIKLHENNSLSEAELYWRMGQIVKSSQDADE